MGPSQNSASHNDGAQLPIPVLGYQPLPISQVAKKFANGQVKKDTLFKLPFFTGEVKLSFYIFTGYFLFSFCDMFLLFAQCFIEMLVQVNNLLSTIPPTPPKKFFKKPSENLKFVTIHFVA